MRHAVEGGMLGRRGTGVAEHSMGVEWGVARGVEVVWKERDKGRDEGWGRGVKRAGARMGAGLYYLR
jgi:hypothetical protein